MQFVADEDFARQLDAEDPLRGSRDKFHLPLGKDGKPLIYFAGNSLGLMPKAARAIVEEELDNWAKLGVDAHHATSTPDAATRHSDAGHHSRCCTCPGPCCDASPVAIIGTGVPLVPSAIRPAARVAVRRTTYVPSEPEHSRPPSVGPPAPHIG